MKTLEEADLPGIRNNRPDSASHLLETLMKYSRDIILFLRHGDGHILAANDAAFTAYGYNRSQLAQMTIFDLRSYETVGQVASQMVEADKSGILFETMHRRKDGSTFPVEVSSKGAEMNGQRILISIVRDISERKRMEQEMCESEERFRIMADGLPVIVWTIDEQGRLVFCNATSLEFFGVNDEEELRGGRWLELVHPDDVESFSKDLFACMRHRKPFTGEARARRADGHWRWLKSWANPRFSLTGKYIGFVGASADITRRKSLEDELRKSHAELEHRVKSRTTELEDKNRELQDFAFIASHDLNAPLRKIQMFGGMVQDHLSRESGHVQEKVDDYFKRMMSSASRMQELLDALLRYSRISTHGENFCPINLNEVIEDVLSDIKIWGTIDVGNLTVIDADRIQMRQLFQNLIENALKYSSDKLPRITIRGKFLDEDGLYEISVSDNGIGFDPQHKELIFGPFQRLHGGTSALGGIGMGLAICRKIVERHKGRIRAESESGKGAAFIITLPIKA